MRVRERPRAPDADLPRRRQRAPPERAGRPGRAGGRRRRGAPPGGARLRRRRRRGRAHGARPTAPRSTPGGSFPGCCGTSRCATPSVELFGRRMPTPLMLAPIGVLELAHREADLAVARAARATGTTMVLSNQASHPMERVVAELGDSPRWFQLYWSRSDELVASLVGRAEAAGCEAIVVTLDTTLLGWRTRDLDQAYLPFLRGKGIAQYTSDPVFNRLVGEPPPAGTPERPEPEADPGRAAHAARAAAQRREPRPGAEVRRDLLAAEAHLGAPGVPARAHPAPDPAEGDPPSRRRPPRDRRRDGRDRRLQPRGPPGRRIDRNARMRCPAVVDAVAGRVPVLLDSGVRSGADVFKALALGARAVLDRPARTSTGSRSPARPGCAR